MVTADTPTKEYMEACRGEAMRRAIHVYVYFDDERMERSTIHLYEVPRDRPTWLISPKGLVLPMGAAEK